LLIKKIEESYTIRLKNIFLCYQKTVFRQSSIHADISEQALLNYEARTEDASNIRVLLDRIRAKQKEYLMVNGLNKKSSSAIVKLLLTAHHGITETPSNLTQNNIFSISPELLNEALELSRKKK